MYFWTDKKFFHVSFLERAVSFHKAPNFNHQNVSCSSSTLVRVVSLVGQCCPHVPAPLQGVQSISLTNTWQFRTTLQLIFFNNLAFFSAALLLPK